TLVAQIRFGHRPWPQSSDLSQNSRGTFRPVYRCILFAQFRGISSLTFVLRREDGLAACDLLDSLDQRFAAQFGKLLKERLRSVAFVQGDGFLVQNIPRVEFERHPLNGDACLGFSFQESSLDGSRS